MNVVKENNNVFNIEAQIDAKLKLLKDNYKKIMEEVKDNEYLVDVLKDYEKYMGTLLEDDKREKEAFELLDRHISNLLEESKTNTKQNKTPMTKQDVDFLKKERSEINKIIK